MRLTLLLVLAIATALGFLPARAAERLVTVTGEATVAVAPDAAMIRIGVTSQGRTARLSMATSNSR